MVRTIGSVCIVIGCIALFVACVPWLSCAVSYPVNAVEIVQQFPSVNVPLEPSGAFSEAAGVCWDAYPVSHERLPLIIGFALLFVGMFARFFGSERREELGLPEHIVEQQRRTTAQRPIETRRHDLSASELAEGIEIDVDLEELGIGNLRDAQFEVEREDLDSVTFVLTRNGVTVRKHYRFDLDGYTFELVRRTLGNVNHRVRLPTARRRRAFRIRQCPRLFRVLPPVRTRGS